MRPQLHRLLGLLDRLPGVLLWTLTLLTALVLGVLDYLTGFEISFAFFYVLPVSLAAWSIGRSAGLVVSVACALIWALANTLAGEQFSSPLIPYWNAVTRSGFFFIVTILLTELRQLLEHERTLARTDFLTGVLNSRAFFVQAAAEISRADRYHRPFTVLYIDLDDFKAINDQMGHDVGDQLLQVVARTIAGTIRSVDTVARLGGDEFVVLLPETDGAAAQVAVPRLRDALLASMRANRWSVTFSIGALTCDRAPTDTQEMIRLADRLMYDVKNGSKDAIGHGVYAG